jgi:hypothetical protein
VDDVDAALDRFRAEIDEPAGRRLVDYAESARDGDWSLRSALVRYAQPEPTRAGAILELVRRTDRVLRPDKRLPKPEVVEADATYRAALRGAVALDGLADVLVAWARIAPHDEPNDEVDRVSRQVFEILGAAGIPREEPPPFRGRG